MGGRFTDPGFTVHEFTGEVLVRCPACGGCALVLAQLGQEQEEDCWADRRKYARRRLRCSCGHTKDEVRAGQVLGGPLDPYFRLPLWLATECRGGRQLWAYNPAHLDLLENCIAAKLRERAVAPRSMSLVERLPSWMKSAGHCQEILRAIGRLRASLPQNRQAGRPADDAAAGTSAS
ncbi:hypothetical protein K353_05811 [Kitasatospora sp. SolWspMP-SS2h]|uniref:hypothetical protein n=1 Tax=Kitasatospora sp. SolWspMP-SS2h TaxID=1305729 RepID=UPI000DB97FC8|nr:hypothetical protein [Kitasatospora sp. SolWspMP-SS2h]RAJ32813.1 hypothetical protein K353_05811 [Kitasatospora sp. SolWspMP-SS2h]